MTLFASTFDQPAARQWLGITLGLIGAAFFATKGIFIKLGITIGIDPLTALAWRMIIAVPIFMIIGLVGYRQRQRRLGDAAPKLDRKTVLQVMAIGCMGYYVGSYLDFAALIYITAQLDRLILLTYPFFVVLFGVVFFKRKVTPMMIASLVVSYTGIALIFAHDFSIEGDNVLLGSMLVLGSAIVYAGYQILAKPLIDKLGAQLFTSVAMTAAGSAVIVRFFITHVPADLAIDGQGLMLMIALGLFSSILPMYLTSAAIGLIGPERAAIIGNVSPLVTVMLAIFVLGEAFTIWHAIGTALVLAGVSLFGRKGKPKVPATEMEP